MKRAVAGMIVIAMLSCCRDRNTPPQAYRHWSDKLAVAIGLSKVGIVQPCWFKVNETKNVAGYERIALDQCFEMDPQRHWKGLWHNEFEGSRFCPAPAKECSWQTPGEKVWLSFPERKSYLDLDSQPGIYEVDFIGRETSYSGNYGHMGASNREMLADRLISIKQLTAFARPPDDGTLK